MSTDIVCESCAPWDSDHCCIGVLYDCKIIVKSMIYDHIAPVIIIVPNEHAPMWKLSEASVLNMHRAVAAVSDVFIAQDQFPNFFTGGNINNAKYGLPGVHAHVHIEPRVKDDPAYNTFPAHLNKKMLLEEELNHYKQLWKKYLNL
jgi:diadenosine tetraphosphate (Ap4A) HIT family hydrolase